MQKPRDRCTEANREKHRHVGKEIPANTYRDRQTNADGCTESETERQRKIHK